MFQGVSQKSLDHFGWSSSLDSHSWMFGIVFLPYPSDWAYGGHFGLLSQMSLMLHNLVPQKPKRKSNQNFHKCKGSGGDHEFYLSLSLQKSRKKKTPSFTQLRNKRKTASQHVQVLWSLNLIAAARMIAPAAMAHSGMDHFLCMHCSLNNYTCALLTRSTRVRIPAQCSTTCIICIHRTHAWSGATSKKSWHYTDFDFGDWIVCWSCWLGEDNG